MQESNTDFKPDYEEQQCYYCKYWYPHPVSLHPAVEARRKGREVGNDPPVLKHLVQPFMATSTMFEPGQR